MVVVVSILLVVVLCFLRSSDALTCHECASPELKTRWHLIGYPLKLKDDAYFTECSGTLAADDQAKTTAGRPVACNSASSACLTVTIPALNEKGLPVDPNTLFSPKYWTVRGCYDKLMTNLLQPVPLTITADAAPIWQYGKITYIDLDGKLQGLGMEMFACTAALDTNYCNGLAVGTKIVACQKTPGAVGCTGPTNMKCQVTNQNQCQGAGWCTKYITSVNGRQTTFRGCTGINPFVPPGATGTVPPTSSCTIYDSIDYLPPNAQNQLSSNTCFCNDKENCNAANRPTAILLGLFLAITPIVLSIFNVQFS